MTEERSGMVIVWVAAGLAYIAFGFVLGRIVS